MAVEVDPEHRALGQSDECQFVIVHCGQPMRWKFNSTTWEGKWPEGSQTTSNSYCCDGCGAELATEIVEPDTRPRQVKPAATVVGCRG